MRLADKIFFSLIHDLFDVPIMSNLHRPEYVERLVERCLGTGFRLVSMDWAGWDIEGPNGLRIEVKQSATRQTWTERPSLRGKVTRGSFDIAPRKGYFDKTGWTPNAGRNAHLYIFAWHPIADEHKADHRDPAQWLFFIVPTKELPEKQKRIARSVVEKRWPAVRFDQIRDSVLSIAEKEFKAVSIEECEHL